jgi:hypothetical protein
MRHAVRLFLYSTVIFNVCVCRYQFRRHAQGWRYYGYFLSLYCNAFSRCSGLCTGESHVPLDGWGFTDSSGPLFSMYLERAEAQDQKMTDRWKADADGILVFVSGHSSMPRPFVGQLGIYRLVCFLPQLQRLSESPSRTSNQTRRIPPRSILQISIRYLRMLMSPSLPRYPPLPHSLRRRPLSGSTPFGF